MTDEGVSVVMPVYNEEASLEKVIEGIQSQILDRLPDARLIVVDDCSTDSSPAILDRIAAGDSRIKIEHSSVNRGHGPTLRRALAMASGDWIFYLDSDDQIPVEEFWKLWDSRGESELVLGRRVDRKDPQHRPVLSRFVSLLVSLIGRRRIVDPNVPFRLIKDRAWREMAPLVSEDAVVPSVMVSLGGAVRGWRIGQIPIQHRAREYGRSVLRPWRLAKLVARAGLELVVFRFRLARGARA